MAKIFQVQYSDPKIQIIHPDNLVGPSPDSVVFQIFDGTWTNKSKKIMEKEELEEMIAFKEHKIEQKAREEVEEYLLEMEAESYDYYEENKR